ncbi:hypothetical protein HPB51_013742 [Rhipicephalus microplus]|uniref:Uncharacterized protein n=1 Tax=Rhipicephalus microplus TaxID=6941 RepID=A0A9J6F2Q2_RHIMP|nr:hypothetical protein HPB51_013742 [Rhipicephalus microplus]
MRESHRGVHFLRLAPAASRSPRSPETWAACLLCRNRCDPRNSESELPECGPRAVCNRVDTYGTPWVERQCRCPGGQSCPRSLDAHDGHTVRDKWRLLKLCEPVDDLPRCRYFRDAAWTVQRLRCQRKEPCRLFTVRKRPDVEEVNASTLCQCPRGWHCPGKHTEAVPGPRYDRVRTYSAYCTAPDH